MNRPATKPSFKIKTTPVFSQSFFQPDEAFSSPESYEKTLAFLTFISKDAETSLTLKEEILVVAIPEGVFIRARNQWATLLSQIAAGKATIHFPIKSLSIHEWTRLTRQYRDPVQSAGDRNLAVWRVGF